MSRLSPSSIGFRLEEVYAKAKACHNNLELDVEFFMNQVLVIIEKQHQAESINCAPDDILMKLHTDDLYLTIACAHSSERAWERLDALYRNHLKKLAVTIYGNSHQAVEMAQDTLTHLFMTDKTGKRRIASYQGLSPLTNWLATIIHHRAIEEWKSPFHHFAAAETILGIADETSMQRIDSATRSNRYSQIANDSLRKACRILNERDKWFLTLRYEEEFKVKTIAEAANLTSQTVTYHIQQAQEKLRKEVFSILKKEYNLNESAIKECIEEILANPAYSLLNLIKSI
jgi:RNA polymerase sigma factor (sigma-70 family)